MKNNILHYLKFYSYDIKDPNITFYLELYIASVVSSVKFCKSSYKRFSDSCDFVGKMGKESIFDNLVSVRCKLKVCLTSRENLDKS